MKARPFLLGGLFFGLCVALLVVVVMVAQPEPARPAPSYSHSDFCWACP